MAQQVPTPNRPLQGGTEPKSRPGVPTGHGPGTWLLWGAAIVLFILAAGLTYDRVAQDGRIYPGVHVADVDVGGLTATEALAALESAGLDPHEPVLLRAGDAQWSFAPEDAGVTFDARATVIAAYRVGRDGPLPAALAHALRARALGASVAPIVLLDEAAAGRVVDAVSDLFDRPAENAALAIDGTTVRPAASVTGRALDTSGSLAAITAATAKGEWPPDPIDLPYNTIAPEVASAEDAVTAAVTLLSGPVALRDSSDEWTLSPEALAPMLTVTNSGGTVVLGLEEGRLAEWMAPATDAISHTARLPRFHFDQASRQLRLLERGESARSVDLPETARRVLAVGGEGPRTVPVAVHETPPPVSDFARADELGIVGLVEEQTSRFVGSPAERIHNIALAAAQFDGVLIPPDAVLSFNETVGDISAETGYAKTKIIMDGTTQEGVGGGVCQVSTTLFRTAFFSGLPIEERYPHGYRVAYYEQGAPPGLDATVYSPIVDLKFRNDTGAWLLVETETDERAATTTFRFLGTRPNRQVALEGPVIGASTPPPAPRVEVDPTLAPGESKTLEYARDGVSVSVTRVIIIGGEESREVFASHYRPTGLVTAVGPAAPSPATPGTGAPSEAAGQVAAQAPQTDQGVSVP